MVPKKITTFVSMLSVCVLLVTACQTASPTPTVDVVGTAAMQPLTALPPSTVVKPTSTNTLPPIATFTKAPTSTITMTAVPVVPTLGAYGPTGFPTNIDPLTGLAVADPTILNRRPVLIKVANFPSSGRPHAGLSFADIVFDYGIDGGTNRFMALFYGQPMLAPFARVAMWMPIWCRCTRGFSGMGQPGLRN